MYNTPPSKYRVVSRTCQKGNLCYYLPLGHQTCLPLHHTCPEIQAEALEIAHC